MFFRKVLNEQCSEKGANNSNYITKALRKEIMLDLVTENK